MAGNDDCIHPGCEIRHVTHVTRGHALTSLVRGVIQSFSISSAPSANGLSLRSTARALSRQYFLRRGWEWEEGGAVGATRRTLGLD